MELSNKIYLKLILRHNNKHNICNEPIAAFVYDFINNDIFYINFTHPDLPPDADVSFSSFKTTLSGKDVYVKNKKSYKYWVDCNLIDVDLFGFISKNELLSETCDTPTHFLHMNMNDVGYVTPYVLHQHNFNEEINKIKDSYKKNHNSYCFKFFNNVVTDTLFLVEKNGLKIDETLFQQHFDKKSTSGYVYSEYHIYNPTGRPSNSHDGINYAALKKDDGSRSSFISRFEAGKLLMVDFTGFHPYIVANLIDYVVPEDETIYQHLAKHYYNIDIVDDDMIKKSKKLTMINLYGQIKAPYDDIEYFKKTEALKDEYWSEFINKGYVKTPIYKRKITNKHINDANKNKLFAYIIQAAETEYSIDRLSSCIQFVSNKPIVPILYNYDAILFDVSEEAKRSDVCDLIEIIKNKRFKVKIYVGKNYNDLKLIPI